VFSPFDLKRLESYTNNMLDYHVIIDLLPLIADLYFSDRTQVSLSGVQRAILLAIGLQRKAVDDLEKELNLPVAQVLAMFIKTIKKFTNAFRTVERAAAEKELPPEPRQTGNGDMNGDKFMPLERDLGEEIEEAGDEVVSALKEKQRELINSLDLEKYALGGTDEDWTDALSSRRKDVAEGMVVSVKGTKDKKRKGESMKTVLDEYEKSTEKSKKKKHKH
jgi:N-acetyltransferase 10